MKTQFVLLVLCLLLLHQGHADDATTESPTTTTPQPTHCDKTGTSCFDCRTLQFCSGVGEANLDFTVSCKTQNINRPYCDANKAECVAENVCDVATVKPEPCYHNGTRPDPIDCSRYVQCSANSDGTGFFGAVVECPTGTRYSVPYGKCVTNAQCILINQYCNTGNAGKLVAYRPYPSIFAKCPAKSTDDIIVKLCKGEYTFNEQVGSCQPICRQEGYIPSNEKCTAYYNCVRNSNGVYSMTLNSCPSGSIFNPIRKLCEQGTKCISLGRSLSPRRRRDVFLLTAGA